VQQALEQKLQLLPSDLRDKCALPAELLQQPVDEETTDEVFFFSFLFSGTRALTVLSSLFPSSSIASHRVAWTVVLLSNVPLFGKLPSALGFSEPLRDFSSNVE